MIGINSDVEQRQAQKLWPPEFRHHCLEYFLESTFSYSFKHFSGWETGANESPVSHLDMRRAPLSYVPGMSLSFNSGWPIRASRKHLLMGESNLKSQDLISEIPSLPPANEVWSNIVFLHLCVILFTGSPVR